MGNTPSRLDPFVEWKYQDIHANIKELQRKLSPYCQEEPLRVVLCGQTGAGKSSLATNIISALKGYYVQIVNVASAAANSVTKMYQEYRIALKDETQTKSLIVLCDTEGVGEENKAKQIEALKKALEGKYAHKQKMDDTEERSGCRKKHAVYVIIVCDATLIYHQDASTPCEPALSDIQSYANTESIPICIFLTKCDKLDKAVGRDITKLYKSPIVDQAISIAAQMFHDFPKGRIFPIVNYTDQRKATHEMMLQTLYALHEIVRDVEASMSCAVCND